MPIIGLPRQDQSKVSSMIESENLQQKVLLHTNSRGYSLHHTHHTLDYKPTNFLSSVFKASLVLKSSRRHLVCACCRAAHRSWL